MTGAHFGQHQSQVAFGFDGLCDLQLKSYGERLFARLELRAPWIGSVCHGPLGRASIFEELEAWKVLILSLLTRHPGTQPPERLPGIP